MMPAPKGVITDIDGTLTDKARVINLEAVMALRHLTARGVPVILATGNVLPITLGLHRFLGLSTPIVAENGGLVYVNETTIHRLARRDVALAALEAVRRSLPAKTLFTDRWRETEVALEPTIPVGAVEKAVAGLGVKVEFTGFAIHLFEPTAGKLPAARLALNGLGLRPEDCLVAGDGDNDVELLEAAAVGVSFPNGSERARAAADYVSSASYGDGFVEALKRYGLLPAP